MTRFIVADDLTGANDAGVQLAKRGAQVVVWLDYARPYDGFADVVVFDTDSRSISPPQAYHRLRTLLGRLGAIQPRDVVKKVDSTLRGNVGAETRAVLDEISGAFAVVCPAYPKNGRTSRDGILMVRGTRVDQTDFARDLFSPIRDARIAAHLDEPSIGIGVETVRAGADALISAIESAKARSIRVAVVDAENDADLRIVAGLQARRDDIVWVCSAGLIEVLEHDIVRAVPERTWASREAVLFLVGSLSAMTRHQVRAFKRHAVVEEVDPSDVLRDAPALASAIHRIRKALEKGHDALLAIAGDRAAVLEALALGAELGWNTQDTGEQLRALLAAAAEPLVRGRPGATFVLSGGDVARSFCDRFGISGMTLLTELAPGIALGRPFGADMYLVTKAGGFGHPETYREILDGLREKMRG